VHEEKEKKSAYPAGDIDCSENAQTTTDTTCCKS